MRTLGTDSLAQEKRWAVVAEIKTAIEKLRNGSGDFGQLVAEALKDRARIGNAAEDEFDSIRGARSEYRDSLLEQGSEDYQLEPRHEKEYAKREELYQLATGRVASIEMLWHLFKDDAAYRELKPKTTMDYKSATKFAFLYFGDVQCSKITSEKCAAFAGEMLKSRAPKTVAKYECPQQFVAMGQAEGAYNRKPLAGVDGYKSQNREGCQGIHHRRNESIDEGRWPDRNERSHADCADTGARLGEIVDARAGDFDGEGFLVAGSKTRAGKRWVPLLGVALAIIKRRARGRTSADPLWPEFTAGGPDGKRSHAASKPWNRWRKELLPDTQIDFHSLRRFWTTMAEQAGVDAITVARLLGHSSPVWSLATYSAGQQRKQLKNGMEKVRKRITAAIDPKEASQKSQSDPIVVER